MAEIILDINGLSKDFGHVKALDDVDFQLKRGEIHALLGMNGAGKSTLTKILSGIYIPDAGNIILDGKPLRIDSPQAAKRYGIASVQQHPELVTSMTCYENILLGQESKKTGLFRKVNRKRMYELAQSTAKKYNIDINLNSLVSDLSPIEKELLSILHALIRENTKILLLDEPTSILTEAEQEFLFSLIKKLSQQGISILYITHHLEEVFQITDRFTIFRNGKRISTMETADAKTKGVNLADLMLGKPLAELYPPKSTVEKAQRVPLLKLENLSAKQAFKDVNLEVKKGEILGIFGLVGSGIHELGDVIFGIRPHSGAGKMYFKNHEVHIKNSRDALNKGIFLLPGDRRTQGLVMGRNAIFNATLANLKTASNAMGLNKTASNRIDVEAILARLDLSPLNIDISASSFSGGNQQKIVMAKGLYSASELYIFVEPTIGVDVGARSKIYTEIRNLAKNNAVILISSDSDEIHGLSDRTVAFYKGNQIGLPKENIARDQLLNIGIGGATVK